VHTLCDDEYEFNKKAYVCPNAEKKKKKARSK
jgi:hypothetical protein